MNRESVSKALKQTNNALEQMPVFLLLVPFYFAIGFVTLPLLSRIGLLWRLPAIVVSATFIYTVVSVDALWPLAPLYLLFLVTIYIIPTYIAYKHTSEVNGQLKIINARGAKNDG